MISYPIDENVKMVKCSSALSQSGLPEFDYALNPYIGCGHGCLYCYAPDIIRHQRGADWGTWVEAKSNISRILRKEVRRLERGTIGLSSVTDPYQPLEERLRLTRSCLEVLRGADFPLIIMTKSALVERDFDILKELEEVKIWVTISTSNEKLAGLIEPHAANPAQRLQLLKDAEREGFETTAMISPAIVCSEKPESEIMDLVDKISDTGCSSVFIDSLRLRSTAETRIRKLNDLRRGEDDFDTAALFEKSSIFRPGGLGGLLSRRYPGIRIELYGR